MGSEKRLLKHALAPARMRKLLTDSKINFGSLHLIRWFAIEIQHLVAFGVSI
jgi:hypothetical protein